MIYPVITNNLTSFEEKYHLLTKGVENSIWKMKQMF